MADIAALVASCRTQIGEALDGITITGGEPFQQPEALLFLLEQLSDWRKAAQLDVLCYSGMSYKRLTNHYGDILAQLDGIIPEPFRDGDVADGAWRGSANQVVISLSELGRKRYDGAEPATRRLQLSVTHDAIWFIGIPRPGDMRRLGELAADRGLVLKDVSWLT